MPSKPSLRQCTLLFTLILPSASALADNSPEEAQRLVETKYLAKVQAACGIELAVEYDAASLRAHNEDVRHEQTDGQRTCGEPLRYLWYACQSPAGRSAVQAAKIARIVCKGSDAKTSTLSFAKGTLTVERAGAERDPHERLRPRFEALLHVSLSFPEKAHKDPYRDSAWTDLQNEPNPTTSTRDYCLVNDKKREFDPHIVNKSQGEDAKVKCWKDGEPVLDLSYAHGKRSGFYTEWNRRGSRRFSYRDGQRDGEQKDFEGTQLKSVSMYQLGKLQWSKEFHPNGALASYSRNFAQQSVGIGLREDGKVSSLSCAPGLADDALLREPCGFAGARTTPVYDGTGQVNRVETWKSGVLESESAGESQYADRSNVQYADGKKHGVERVLDEQGKLAATITWNRGVKEGKESEYAEGGSKLVKELIWRAGELAQTNELYLNGNPKQKELFDKPDHKEVISYWDTGKVRRQGGFGKCSDGGYRYWCEEGLFRSFFEDGRPAGEENYKNGQQHGTSKSWWPNGKLQADEKYNEGRCTERKQWDRDGKLTIDEAYEADGSRKLKR